MIIDAFIFHNELAMLDLRREILGAEVDAMLLVEGSHTFQGKPREPRGHFLAWDRNVDTYIAQLPEQVSEHWEREYAQRNAIADALAMKYELHDNDVILISDVDEIPDPEELPYAVERARQGDIVAFKQIHTYFYLDLVDDEPWYGTRALTWGKLKTTSPQDIRSVKYYEGQVLLEKGGWHFGWTGDNDQIRDKLASFCHDDLNDPHLNSDSYLNHCRRSQVTMHNSHKLRKLPLEQLPACIRENPSSYQQMLTIR